MERRKEVPEVNAGSMADIAFLLLIFFLVTTTIETDVGLDRKLPPAETTPPPKIPERNIFRVSLNKNDELFVEDGLMEIDNLRSAAITFLDNGGIPQGTLGHCNYCNGKRNSTSSDNPTKAVISFNADREAEYGMYIKVQNELAGAYNELRNREALRLFGVKFSEMEKIYKVSTTTEEDKKMLKERIFKIREMYPMKLSEAETKMDF